MKRKAYTSVHITFLTAVMISLLASIVVVLNGWEYHNNNFDELMHKLTNDRKIELTNIIDSITSRFRKISATFNANSKNIEDIFAKSTHYQDELSDSVGMMPNVTSVYVSDSNGNYFEIPDRKTELTYDPRKRPWFITPEDGRNALKFSYGYKDIYTSKYIFSLSGISKSENDNYLILGMDIDINSLNGLYDNMKYTFPVDMFILDLNGNLVLGDRKKWELERSNLENKIYSTYGSFKVTNKGIKYYYSKMYNPGWVVVLSIKSEIIDKNIILLCAPPFLCVLILLVVIFLCWWRSCHELNLFHSTIINKLHDIDISSVDHAINLAIDKKKRKLSEMERSAKIDGLTGLLNRRTFDNELAQVTSIPDNVCILAIIDIDNFKIINDTYGHPTGDDVLRAFASMARNLHELANLRLYRYGGEEFAIIFRDMDFTSAKNILDDFRVAFSLRNWRESINSVTFSAGLKKWNGESAAQLISQTDALLYTAKKSGKNNINGEVFSKGSGR